MEVHSFRRVTFQAGAWKQGWAEPGRITYRAAQDHAALDIELLDGEKTLRLRASKGTKVLVSGNGIHLPDGLR
jgi:hypothetical protein